MRGLRFWKRKSPAAEERDETPVIGKFGIQPRTDVGDQGLPDDPDIAARVSALRRRWESLLQELRVAEEAEEEDNQWRRQIGLISEALEIVERERAALGDIHGAEGAAVPAVPITDISVEMEPVATVRFKVGDVDFVYAEELDWAERGTQIARSDLHREQGEIEALVPADFPPGQRSDLVEHLKGSLFGFATDVRDGAIDDQQLPKATLADLARPSAEFGGWLDWSGHSPVAQARQLDLNRLRAERERLEAEQLQLLDDEAKMVETIPVIRRRLADVEQQLASLTRSA